MFNCLGGEAMSSTYNYMSPSAQRKHQYLAGADVSLTGVGFGVSLVIKDLTNFRALLEHIRIAMKCAGEDVLNDMAYCAKGAAPFDTGQLEGNIAVRNNKWTANKVTGGIGISSWNRGFDYGALRHDYPFQLGEGSLNKLPVVSPITGESFVTGYAFASETANGNAEGYFKYIEEQLDAAIKRYT